MRPSIGVVIPCFNRQKTIRASVLSVINQTIDCLVKIVVVDDGSTDLSIKLIEDLPVQILHTQGRKGACFARNLGISVLDVDWVMFNDSDDLWLPNKLETLMPIFLSQNVNWLAHGFVRLNQSGSVVVINPSIRENVVKRLLYRNFISTQCLAVKRDLLVGVGGFDENLKRFQDWDLAIRLATNSHNFMFLNEILSLCFEQTNSLSKSFTEGVKSRQFILNKHRVLYKKYYISLMFFKLDYLIRSFIYFVGGYK